MDHDNAHDLKLVRRKSIGIILSSVLKNSPLTPHTKYGVTQPYMEDNIFVFTK